MRFKQSRGEGKRQAIGRCTHMGSNEEGEPVPRERVRGDGARRVVLFVKAKARGG